MDRHPADIVGQLLEGAWTASALARLLERGVDETLPAADASVPLLSRAGLLEPHEDGFVLRDRDLVRGVEPVVLATIRSVLGQAHDIAKGTASWSEQSDEVLLAQGMASAAGGRGFAQMIGVLPGLAEAFEHDGVVLDVGVGVAGLACAFCEAVPHARVIGIDVLPRALALARQLVEEKGLADRVDLRQVGIEEFDETAVADFAHMSPVFIPPTVLAEGLKRLRAALKTGGWLALSGIVGDGDGVTRWMAYQAGGSALTDAEATSLAAAAGFAAPIVPPLPPGAPRVLLFRAS